MGCIQTSRKKQMNNSITVSSPSLSHLFISFFSFFILSLSMILSLLFLCVFLRPTIYSSEQGFFLTLVGWGQSTARMASSNTVFRPRWVKAEHSRYFTESIHTYIQAHTHNGQQTSIEIHILWKHKDYK